MEKRRQNQSCEECRKSKKACDGHVVNSTLSNLRARDSEYLSSQKMNGQLKAFVRKTTVR